MVYERNADGAHLVCERHVLLTAPSKQAAAISRGRLLPLGFQRTPGNKHGSSPHDCYLAMTEQCIAQISCKCVYSYFAYVSVYVYVYLYVEPTHRIILRVVVHEIRQETRKVTVPDGQLVLCIARATNKKRSTALYLFTDSSQEQEPLMPFLARLSFAKKQERAPIADGPPVLCTMQGDSPLAALGKSRPLGDRHRDGALSEVRTDVAMNAAHDERLP